MAGKQFDNLGEFISAMAGMAMSKAFENLEGFDKASFRMEKTDGKKLEELELDGAEIGTLALLGPDTVNVVTGEKLAIEVVGEPEASEGLRFKLEDGKLAIMRTGARGSERVTVTVTTPALRKISLMGSGSVHCAALTGEDAKIQIAGSGSATCDKVEVDKLKIRMMGSGSLIASGKAEKLSLKIAGSGSAKLDALETGAAKINIMGSGSSRFASDGEVEANMAGSGSVTVKGRARLKVKGMGSGSVVCEPA